MFFQAMLLLGYLYAHVSSRYLDARRQALVHLGLLALALLSLPVAIPGGWTPPATGNVIPWLLRLLAVAVGVPFLVFPRRPRRSSSAGWRASIIRLRTIRTCRTPRVTRAVCSVCCRFRL